MEHPAVIFSKLLGKTIKSWARVTRTEACIFTPQKHVQINKICLVTIQFLFTQHAEKKHMLHIYDNECWWVIYMKD